MLHDLSEIQRKAVEWDDGAVLVLGGPGSGKTRVLTCRIAQLLHQSPRERFRVLALTFTNKAAYEMSRRLVSLGPGLRERAEVHTFHSWCAQVLRQHGAHLGIKPDFAIYSRTGDRRALLDEILRRELWRGRRDSRRLLNTIDALKGRLVGPGRAEAWLVENKGVSIEEACSDARAYRLYEDELREANALDFNSLVFEAHRLLRHPALARQQRPPYKYLLVDDFQDITGAQYELLRCMVGKTPTRVFAVADDDQTIFEWNGANVRRVRILAEEFQCQIVRLPTNYRCSPLMVKISNRLIEYNTRRGAHKQPARPERRCQTPAKQQVRCRVFESDRDEVAAIAKEIADLDADDRDQTVVLARTRARVESVRRALQAENLPTAVLTRRDQFTSPQMRWLVTWLQQIQRPSDRRNMAKLVETFDSFAPVSLEFDDLRSRAAAEGASYLAVWSDAACRARLPPRFGELARHVALQEAGEVTLASAVGHVLCQFEVDLSDEDLKEDLSAWHRLSSESGTALTSGSLGQFLQELELQSKAPAAVPGAVCLSTIHGVKGPEFNTVYVIGLAEGVLPSWFSLRDRNGVASMEEERRNCYVAITRAKQHLILSRAEDYEGRRRQPSRFLAEMGFRSDGSLCAFGERTNLDRRQITRPTSA